MIWYDVPTYAWVSEQLNINNATIVGLRDYAFARIAAPPSDDQHDSLDYLTACAVAHRLGHESALQLGFAAMIKRLREPTKDLGRAANLLAASVLIDAHADAANATQHASVPDELISEMRATIQSLRTFVDRGNPHQAGNNWWAVTHGGVVNALCALNAIGHQQADDDSLLAWAWGRLQAFCTHFGDAGLYHEGLGYQRYTGTFLLSAITAMGRRQGFVPAERFPWMLRYASSLLATTLTRWNKTEHPDNWGSALSWNDAGTGWGGSADIPLAVATMSAEEQGAIRTLFDHLHGEKSEKPNWCAGHCGTWFFFVCYPYAVPASDPNGTLPTNVLDSRQGLCIWRDHYGTGDELVLGFYIKHTHVGGHKQADAGSIRYAADDHDWLLGGGQARPRAEWQSVCFPVGEEKGDATLHSGWLMYVDETKAGPVWGADMRKTSRCYHERYVTVHRDAHVLSILDLIDDHNEREWSWNITVPRYFDLSLDANAVLFKAPDGATGRLTFAGLQPESIEIDALPDSKRTYSSGGTVEYPGHALLRVRFGNAEHHVIHALLATAGPGKSLAEVSGDAHEIVITRDGESNVWSKPYAEALSANWSAQRGGGTAKWPDGVPEDA